MEQKVREATLRRKYDDLRLVLSERARRLWAATEAQALGRGGISVVMRATGMSIATIRKGIQELSAGVQSEAEARRVRRPGGGRKRLTERNPELKGRLERLLESTTRGDPQSSLRWTCKSVRRLAAELQREGYEIGHQRVAELLSELGYSLQANAKTIEGSSQPDRDAQFEHIATRVKEFQSRGQPVISVDTKKKELVGNYKNSGREWCPKGTPEKVKVHDFADPQLGKAIPYGVYDPSANSGWVSVGVDHDTAQFAVETIRQWWSQMGRERYPAATDLLITADAGGSNGSRNRLWKLSLQKLADALGIRISVCHLPPGTSKWNKIEHRLFSFITLNWRGRPLTSHEVIVNLIANTTTRKGLKIQAALDTAQYPTGIKVTNQELAQVKIIPHDFHGDWTYTIAPKS